MGKKYIIELPENTHWIQWILESTKDHHPYIDFKQIEDLTPYIEPDMELVRKEAFEKGYNTAVAEQECAVRKAYEQGRKDGKIEGQAETWVCVKKIATMDSYTRDEVFDEVITTNIIENYSASEAIEKIRQYEQEEQIQAGDEVIYGKDDDGSVGIVTKMKGGSLYVTWADGSSGLHNADGFEKTGRHFPEIAEVLQKMKEAE